MCILHDNLPRDTEFPNFVAVFFSTAKIDKKSKTQNLYVREFQADLKRYTSKLNVQNGLNGQNSKSKMVMNLEHLI